MSVTVQKIREGGNIVPLIAALQKIGGEIELTDSDIERAHALLFDEANKTRRADQIMGLFQTSQAYYAVTEDDTQGWVAGTYQLKLYDW